MLSTWKHSSCRSIAMDKLPNEHSSLKITCCSTGNQRRQLHSSGMAWSSLRARAIHSSGQYLWSSQTSLRQLAASSYQQCKRLLHNAALLTMGWQCGTVCQQHCQTVAWHRTPSSGDWKCTYLQHDEHHPALLRRFYESGAVIWDSWLTLVGLNNRTEGIGYHRRG